MKTNIEKAQFVLDTLMVYAKDPSKRGISVRNGVITGCTYLSKEGNKCAVGMHMKDGPWQNSGDFVETIKNKCDKNSGDYEGVSFEDDILTEEAAEMNLSMKVWGSMQEYHDGIENDRTREYSLEKIAMDLNVDINFFKELM